MIAYLKPYPTMKNSGVPWLGEVPAHWNTRPLKRWVTINAEVLPETTAPDRVFRYVDIGSVGTGTLTQKPQRLRFAGAPSRARRVVHKGDTLVSTVRTYLKAIYFVDGEADELVCSTGFAVLTPRVGTVPQFVSYQARSNAFTDRVTADSVGIAYPAVAESRLGSFHVAIPPLPEQSAIVHFLDHADRRIRRYIHAKQKLVTLLEEQKQALIHQAVAGQIDVRTGQPYPAYKPSGVEWLGDVPEHWEVIPFKQRVGFQEGPGIMAADFRESGVPLLRISCLSGKVATLGGCNYLDPDMVRARWNHFAVSEGDYLLSASASTGAVSLATSEVAGSIPYTGIIRLWTISQKTVMAYVELFMSSRLFQDQIDRAKSGVAIEHFGPKHLNQMVITLPPAPDQKAIVGAFKEAIEPLASATVSTHRQINLLREYRTRLIADVVTGKLDVREAASRLPDEVEELDTLDKTDALTEGKEEPSDDLDAAPEEAAV